MKKAGSHEGVLSQSAAAVGKPRSSSLETKANQPLRTTSMVSEGGVSSEGSSSPHHADLRRASGMDGGAFVKAASVETFSEAASLARTNFEHRRESAHEGRPPSSPSAGRRQATLKKNEEAEKLAKGGSAPAVLSAKSAAEDGSLNPLRSESTGSSIRARSGSQTKAFAARPRRSSLSQRARRLSLFSTSNKQKSKRLANMPTKCEECGERSPKARVSSTKGVRFLCKECVGLAKANFAEFGTVSRSATGVSLYPETEEDVIVDCLVPVCDVVGLAVKLNQSQSVGQALLHIATSVARRTRRGHYLASGGDDASPSGSRPTSRRSSRRFSLSATNLLELGGGQPVTSPGSGTGGSRLGGVTAVAGHSDDEGSTTSEPPPAALPHPTSTPGSAVGQMSAQRSDAGSTGGTEEVWEDADLLVFDSPPSAAELVNWRLWLPPPRNTVLEPANRRLADFDVKMMEQMVLRPTAAPALPPMVPPEQVHQLSEAVRGLAVALTAADPATSERPVYVLRLAAAAFEAAYREARECQALPTDATDLQLDHVLRFRPFWQLLRVSIQRQQSGELIGFWLLYDQMQLFASRKGDSTLLVEAREIARLLIRRYFTGSVGELEINVGTTAFAAVKVLEKRLGNSNDELNPDKVDKLPDGDELAMSFRQAARDIRENMHTGFTSFVVDFASALQDILDSRQLYAVDSLAWAALRLVSAVRRAVESVHGESKVRELMQPTLDSLRKLIPVEMIPEF